MKSLLLLSVFTGTSLAQAAAYAQCGGTGWTGETTCVSGWTCKVQNPYYSQCVQSDSADDVSSAAAAVTTAAAAAQTTVVSKPFVSTPAQTEAKAASTSSKKIACGSKATTLRTRTRTIKTTTAAAATVKASSAAAVVSIKTTSIAPVVTLKTTTKAAQTTAAAAVTTAKAVVTTTKRATTSTTTKAKTTSTTAKAAAATTAASSSDSSSSSGLKWVGVDESGAEFGTAYPGTYGVDFIFPDTTTIGTLISEGYNIFRVPFMMERMAVGSITATLDTAYLANLTTVVDYITSNGGWAALDPHNYGRYDGAVITSTSDFQTFWKNLATHFADNDNVIFDTNNEYHDMDQTLVLDLNQAAIDGIRAAGATSQYIFVEGNAYTGAWSWNTTNTNLAALTDTEDKIIYEMHQYLDSDSSGTSETCVSSTIGVERVEGATEWLRENGKLGIIGEFAGGANSVCMEAVTGMLDHLQTNSDVWMGAVWWAAGPWWGDYMYSFEPTSGTGYEYYDSLLKTYAP